MADMANNPSQISEKDRESLVWLIDHAQPGQWTMIADGLKMIQNHGGWGRLEIGVQQNKIAGRPKVEVTLGNI